MPVPFRTSDTHRLAVPREKLWSILSNTDWLNRTGGVPPVEYQIAPGPAWPQTLARARLGFLNLAWEEHPFQWIEPEFYTFDRSFSRGPFRVMRGGMEFREIPSGTELFVHAEMHPRHWVGAWLARFVVAPIARRDMARIVRHAERHLAGAEAQPLPSLPRTPVNSMALQEGLRPLEGVFPPPLIRQLADLLTESPDVALLKIRPLALARAWGADPTDVLRLFLHATRAGLLDLTWEVLCPNCRSSRQPPIHELAALRGTMHCEACQITYDGQFDRSVELKFSINASLKRVAADTFCLAGPGSKAHVFAQLVLAPGEQKELAAPDAALRVRSPRWASAREVPPATPAALEALETGWIDAPPAPSRGLRLRNGTAAPLLVSCERLAWSADILTAARVASLQAFRDLFASEVLSPAEEIRVGQQVLLFTDLRGSTAMYAGLGDAPAYALVRDHFAVLRDAIAAHQGAIVKTIGDAVMAVFTESTDALQAALQMHHQLAALGQTPALFLKSSVHAGPCLAVNANGRLDYFGTTVNLAARLVESCRGGDLALSEDFAGRAGVRDFLAQHLPPPEVVEQQFRGFDSPLKIHRYEIQPRLQP